jgi:hypothetical protein
VERIRAVIKLIGRLLRTTDLAAEHGVALDMTDR